MTPMAAEAAPVVVVAGAAAVVVAAAEPVVFGKPGAAVVTPAGGVVIPCESYVKKIVTTMGWCDVREHCKGGWQIGG